MSADQDVTIRFRINNNKKSDDENTRIIRVHATQPELDEFAATGVLVRRGWFSVGHLERLRDALDRIDAEERDAEDAEHRSGNGLFLRILQDKDPVFRDLMTFEPPLSVARAMLGPQVAFEVDARVAYTGEPGNLVPWHIHRRVVPDPLPPFFCYPHGVHCLIYLDDVGAAEGPLVYLPGSHLDHTLDLPHPTTSDLPGQVVVQPRAGDAVLIHSNLWHRTLPTSEACRQRRLLIAGYEPAWLSTGDPDDKGAESPLTAEMRISGDSAERELAHGFRW